MSLMFEITLSLRWVGERAVLILATLVSIPRSSLPYLASRAQTYNSLPRRVTSQTGLRRMRLSFKLVNRPRFTTIWKTLSSHISDKRIKNSFLSLNSTVFVVSEEWFLWDSSLLAEIEFCIWCHLSFSVFQQLSA